MSIGLNGLGWLAYFLQQKCDSGRSLQRTPSIAALEPDALSSRREQFWFIVGVWPPFCLGAMGLLQQLSSWVLRSVKCTRYERQCTHPDNGFVLGGFDGSAFQQAATHRP